MQEIWVTIIEDLGNTEYIFEYDGRFYDLFITFFVTNTPKLYHLWLEDSTGQWVVRDVGLEIKGHGSDELDKLARLD